MNIDMQSLIAEMSELVTKIKSGSATQGEIEAFTAAAAELHERAVVLRYKSYEAQVFGTTPEYLEPLDTTAETAVAEELVTTEAAVETDEPDIHFSLFEEPQSTQESEPEGFDLFSLDDQEDPGTVEETTISESSAQEAFSVVNPEQVIEHPVVEQEPETAIPVMEDRPLFSQSATVPEAPYDEIKPQVETYAAEEESSIHPLYNRLKTDDDSLAAKLMAVRLETLNGAFGFNERMQIVQELFQGSNDAFSEAIDTLDRLDSKNAARQKVSAYANRFSWDERSDLVMEFVQKVERRYA